MPKRSLIFATGEMYHIYNRSVAKEEIFTLKRQLNKALEITQYYLYPQRLRLSKYHNLTVEAKENYISSMKNIAPLVELYAYTFMPNHFHFLIKQTEEKGISKFMSNFQNSYAKYYNIKFDRQGSLFQDLFKAKRIENNEEFIHVARYIHLNHVTSYLIEFSKLIDYPWCSFHNYINGHNSFVNIDHLLKNFCSVDKFIKFHEDQVDYQRKLKDIKRLTFE